MDFRNYGSPRLEQAYTKFVPSRPLGWNAASSSQGPTLPRLGTAELKSPLRVGGSMIASARGKAEADPVLRSDRKPQEEKKDFKNPNGQLSLFPCIPTERRGGKISNIEAIADKDAFAQFLVRASKSMESPEYKEFYRFMLKCFTDADTDFDGQVGADDFDVMVERAMSLAWKFGFARPSHQLHANADARRRHRADIIRRMDANGNGLIAFDEWLEFGYKHMCEKIKALHLERMEGFRDGFTWAGFRNFIIVACRDTASMEYKELYRWVLHCFQMADMDLDGRVGFNEFDILIDTVAAESRRLEFEPLSSHLYRDEVHRRASRKIMFEKMDEDGSGFIAFEEFFNFIYKHICEKVSTMPDAPPVGLKSRIAQKNFAPNAQQKSFGKEAPLEFLPTDKEGFVKWIIGATKGRNTQEYMDLYKFLLRCFCDADRDFDGAVGPEDFDMMVEQAGSLPRKFGFAPTAPEQFATANARRRFRADMFAQMDENGNGFIAFDEWLEFCYKHICDKAKLLQPDHVKWKIGTFDKVGFQRFIVAACRGKTTMEYKDLYGWLLQRFTDADQDRDGRVNAQEFNALIELSVEEPRRLGFAPKSDQVYKTDAERFAGRKKIFESMDADGSGFIAFDEFLQFTYDHICEKVKQLPGVSFPNVSRARKIT